MPQYHLAMYYDQESDAVPDDLPQIMAELEALNAEMRDAGAWVMAAGFDPAPEARVVRADPHGAETTVGAYLPSQEQQGGFWLIEAHSMGDAIVWAERASRVLRLAVEVRAVRT
ncbi:YciI family protein [Demequina iriomotensis]|uniref:YciI family protein n=1 Tax=Demequina iriomotensis TaxID=1536641 RepID=UPI0007846BF0|nr:YciI family protein [Demequina iriomotensis]